MPSAVISAWRKIGAGVDWSEVYSIPGNDLLVVDTTKIALALHLIIDILFNSNYIFLQVQDLKYRLFFSS